MRTSQHTGVSTFASRTSPSTDQSLQKSFHLSYADKIELKKISFPSENKKYPTAHTDTTYTMIEKLYNDNGLQGQTTRTTGYNTVLPKWRQKCYYETFVLNSTVVILLNFSANNPPLRQYPNRCMSPYLDTAFLFDKTPKLCHATPTQFLAHGKAHKTQTQCKPFQELKMPTHCPPTQLTEL